MTSSCPRNCALRSGWPNPAATCTGSGSPGEVLSHLGGGAFSYRRFDCSQMHLAGAVEVPDAPLLIVEGSYSMLPQFRDSYGLSVFLATDLDTQLRRIAARGGADKLEAFRTRWIPMEKAYHDAFGVRSACRFAFDT